MVRPFYYLPKLWPFILANLLLYNTVYSFQENAEVEYRISPYIINDTLRQETLGKHLFYIEDQEHLLTIHDLLKEDNDIIWKQS
ncbi:MAG: hypothetical protein OEY51_00620, partial [Cyclobacteriaceae bacterium]|nr:hypothetical protein [Cyclobacteriaceae bacterium]